MEELSGDIVLEIEELVDKKHKEAFSLCEEKFMTKQLNIKLIWLVVSIICVLYGSAVAWAVITTSRVSVVETRTDYNEKAITTINDKLDKILSQVTKK
jgi:hypothetical protein